MKTIIVFLALIFASGVYMEYASEYMEARHYADNQ